MPAQPSIDALALQPLLRLYPLSAIVRTDDDGRFKLIKTPAKEFYAVMAFARDRLPFEMGNHGFREQLKKGPKVDTGDFPLFPAARLQVHPVFPKSQGRVSLSPHWVPVKDGQPEWFPRFRAAKNLTKQREFSYVHWMKLNEAHPILVPAEVRFRIEFRCPYDDKWVPENRPQVFQLREATQTDFGKLTFAAALEVEILVVGPDGNAFEGAPVRRLQKRGNAKSWSIAHNTDANGVARFFVPARTSGQFGVHFRPKMGKSIQMRADFKTNEKSLEKPIRIQLTAGQIATLRGKKK